MYYTTTTNQGRFNLASPGEVMFSNRVIIYNDDGSLIKAVSVVADSPIFYDDDEPEDIAKALEKWLKGMFYASDEDNIKDMIQFLRKHSKELLEGKLRKDIEGIEKKIKRLEEEKKMLVKRYKEILADDEEGNGQKVREDGIE